MNPFARPEETRRPDLLILSGVRKPANIGGLVRSAYAYGFGAVFSDAQDKLVESRKLIRKCSMGTVGKISLLPSSPRTRWGVPLVGAEPEEGISLRDFTWPRVPVGLVLGGEGGGVLPEMRERLDFLVRIPTRICLNVGHAGAVLMDSLATARGWDPELLGDRGERR